MTQRDRTALLAEIDSLIPDNTTEEVSPADVRSVLVDMIDSIPFAMDQSATGQPGISGTPEVGETLTATAGTIDDPDGLPSTAFPAGYTFQWTRNGTDLAGQTAQTYTVVAADVGALLRVQVSFTDAAGNSEGPLESTSVRGRAVARTDPRLYIAAKADMSDFSAADFLAGDSSNTDSVTPGMNLPGQVRLGIARRSDLGAATTIEQHGQPPNERALFTPAVGMPNDVIQINGADYYRYTYNGTLQGMFISLIPWEVT